MFNFGQTSNAQPATTSAFNFGGSSNQSQSSSAFLFGGGFGSNAAAAPSSGAAPSFSLFGSSQQQQSAAAQPQQQSAFSFSQPQQPQQQGFGAQSQQQGFGTQPQTFQPQYPNNPIAAAAPPPYPFEQIRAITDAYNPQSPTCQFQTFFYTKVDPSKIDQYIKPLHISTRRWLLAQKQNPEPSTMVPVHAVGFSDLHKRIQQQHKASEQLRAQLKHIVSTLDDIQHTFISSTLSNLQTAVRQHQRLQHRLLQVTNKIQLLRTHDVPFMSTEMEYSQRLQHLQQQLNRPTVMQNRAKEYASIAEHTVQQQLHSQQHHTHQHHTKLDPTTENNLYSLLDIHRQALAHSSNVMRLDAADLKVIQQYEQQEENSTVRSQQLLLQ